MFHDKPILISAGRSLLSYCTVVLVLIGTLPNVSFIGTGLQNLRECILWTQTKHDFEPKKKRPFWKQMSKNFIERYVYLIVFTTYVKAFSHRGM